MNQSPEKPVGNGGEEATSKPATSSPAPTPSSAPTSSSATTQPATSPSARLPPEISPLAAPSKPAPPPQTATAKPGILRSTIAAGFHFIRFMITLPVVLIRGRRGNVDEVTVYSAHPSFFLWALILVGFVSAAVVRKSPDWAGVFGWIYVFVLVYFFATLLYDFSARKLGLWVLIFVTLWLLAKYIENIKEVAVIGFVFSYFVSLKPKLDPGSVTVLSWLLVLPWFGSLIHMALNGRKKFSPNEIDEFHFGEGSELTDRSGLRFRTKYRDVLETMLTFGGGDLLAVDNHQTVIKRWDNVIGLFFFWKDLDRVLHQRAAVMETGDEKKDE